MKSSNLSKYKYSTKTRSSCDTIFTPTQNPTCPFQDLDWVYRLDRKYLYETIEACAIRPVAVEARRSKAGRRFSHGSRQHVMVILWLPWEAGDPCSSVRAAMTVNQLQRGRKKPSRRNGQPDHRSGGTLIFTIKFTCGIKGPATRNPSNKHRETTINPARQLALPMKCFSVL